jgi:hypothetical protein
MPRVPQVGRWLARGRCAERTQNNTRVARPIEVVIGIKLPPDRPIIHRQFIQPATVVELRSSGVSWLLTPDGRFGGRYPDRQDEGACFFGGLPRR